MEASNTVNLLHQIIMNLLIFFVKSLHRYFRKQSLYCSKRNAFISKNIYAIIILI